MPTEVINTKNAAATTKKTLKKKVTEKTVEEPVKKVATKKATKEVVKTEKVKAEKPVKAKATKTEKVKAEKVEKPKKSPKAKKEKAETDEEKPEKTPKKINTKPTLSDTQGLNLSIAKVKNIIADHCVNKEITTALKEMKAARVFKEEGSKEFTFKLTSLSAETLDFLDLCHADITEANGVAHSKKVVKEMDEDRLAEYNEKKKQALAEFESNKKVDGLFTQDKFDLNKFNLEFDSEFYAGMEDDADSWKELKNEELYAHCVSTVTKNKIRFNSESKIFITAFTEYIIKQLVINGTTNCVNEKKKIIKLRHGLEKILPNFTLFTFVTNTIAYRNYLANLNEEASEKETPVDDAESDVEKEETGKVPQFKYYVSELCREVRMQLSNSDEEAEDATLSKYNQTSVSKEFKQFCSDVVIELLHIFGNVLKTEVITRNVKTVNYDIVSALIYNAHIFHNAKADDTIKFIQASYNKHSEYVKERHENRVNGKKSEENDDDEE